MGQTSAESRALPGRSTLYRHRMTLYLAYCLQQQYALAQLLSAGVLCYGAMDSSPLGAGTCAWR
eukprot:4011756-Alexandrium_andersonii.AAC.1